MHTIQFNSIKALVSLILCFTILMSCKKSDSSDSTPAPVWTNIRVETGLRSNEIVDMIFDQSGNIWAAFAQGVGKFDGTSWIIYKPFHVDPSERILTIMLMQLFKIGVVIFG